MDNNTLEACSQLEPAIGAYPSDTFSPNHGEIADSLLFQGQTQLLKGNLLKGLECFDSASRLSPQNPKNFYSQGLSLFDYGSKQGKEKTLLQANKKFKVATTIHPDYLEAWQAWGSALCQLGLIYQENHYFQDAAAKLKKAISLAGNRPASELFDLYWDYAVVSTHLGKNSGEVIDLHEAIDYFQKATTCSSQLSAEFWHDFGRCSLLFAQQTHGLRFYMKAISCFKHAISLDPSTAESWELLASSLEGLYHLTHDEDHFTQAQECLATAEQLQPASLPLLLHSAASLLESIRLNPDTKKIKACIERCQHALSIDPKRALAKAIRAEALALLGEQTERLDLLTEAHNQLAELVEKVGHLPEIWMCYGMCLNTLARYFQDDDYYYQAIEKFQEALSLDRTLHAHWYQSGKAYTTLGELEQEPENFYLAIRFFQKAIDLQINTFYIIDYAICLAKLGEINHHQPTLNEALLQFEKALHLQKNALYLHPNWLYHYAATLDSLGDLYEEEFYYLRAIEIFSHILMIDPDFHLVHHRMALTLFHLGDFKGDVEPFFRAIHHYRLSLKQDEDNDLVFVDWALTLIHLTQYLHDPNEIEQFYRDAEHKLIAAAKLGNLQSYYHLSGLYSLMKYYEKAMFFLEKAKAFDALPPLEEILQDEWLENVKMTGDFREFLFQLEKQS